MLEELRIQNFAIIDRLELTFAPGFKVINGETGAGKSIIIDAVELLLGGKADPGAVRASTERLLVEGVFALSGPVAALVEAILQREDIPEGEPRDYITLSREVRSNGRSTGRVNGVTVNQEILREIGLVLVDVHGQSEHLSLLNPRAHIDLLDRYAELTDMRLALESLVDRVSNTRAEIRRLVEDEAALKRRAEQLRYEVEEIDAAELRPGEEEELRAEGQRIGNSEQLATMTAEALALLYGDERAVDQLSAVDQLMQASVIISKLVNIDPDRQPDADLAESLSAQAEELALSLRRYADTMEYDPDRLNEVEERLELITRLRRRFGASVEDVLNYADRARAELGSIEHSEERLVELRAEEEKLLRHIGEVADRISRVRVMIGQKMSQRIVAELGDLRMEGARFEVAITREDDPEGCYIGDGRYAFDSTGVDRVEFMMSANPGEPIRPLVKVASGGETARIMLALKRVLAQADQTPTLIFDEIDSGIGGRVGATVGEKLWSLASNHQVMVVTHLAQLAGYGDRHFHVRKLVQGNRTTTQVVPLDDENGRAAELADMLGAQGESARLSARDLLAQAQTFKRDHAPARPSRLL